MLVTKKPSTSLATSKLQSTINHKHDRIFLPVVEGIASNSPLRPSTRRLFSGTRLLRQQLYNQQEVPSSHTQPQPVIQYPPPPQQEHREAATTQVEDPNAKKPRFYNLIVLCMTALLLLGPTAYDDNKLQNALEELEKHPLLVRRIVYGEEEQLSEDDVARIQALREIYGFIISPRACYRVAQYPNGIAMVCNSLRSNSGTERVLALDILNSLARFEKYSKIILNSSAAGPGAILSTLVGLVINTSDNVEKELASELIIKLSSFNCNHMEFMSNIGVFPVLIGGRDPTAFKCMAQVYYHILRNRAVGEFFAKSEHMMDLRSIYDDESLDPITRMYAMHGMLLTVPDSDRREDRDKLVIGVERATLLWDAIGIPLTTNGLLAFNWAALRAFLRIRKMVPLEQRARFSWLKRGRDAFVFITALTLLAYGCNKFFENECRNITVDLTPEQEQEDINQLVSLFSATQVLPHMMLLLLTYRYVPYVIVPYLFHSSPSSFIPDWDDVMKMSPFMKK